MRLRDFIREHRDEIDQHIRQTVSYVPRTASCTCPRSGTEHYCETDLRLNDGEREQWVLNDEGLYRWAQGEGVRI